MFFRLRNVKNDFFQPGGVATWNNVADAGECCAKCMADVSCGAFSYSIRHKTCYAKVRDFGHRPDPDCVSGRNLLHSRSQPWFNTTLPTAQRAAA